MKKLITWLYKKFVNPSIEDLILDELSLVSYSVDVDNMPDEERKEFLLECYRQSNDDHSKKLRDTLIDSQRDATLEQSTSEKGLLCGRSAWYGIGMYNRELERYAMMHEELLKEEGKIDKHQVI